MNLLTAAIQYAELGYRVFPCVPGDKRPLTSNGCKAATADVDLIDAWWTKWPDANIGLATDGLLVIDVDGKDNLWPADPLCAATLAEVPRSNTPRGGRHYFFRQPEGKAWRCTTSKLSPNVDTRADGGYVLVAPSVVGGITYCWTETHELDCGPDKLPLPHGWTENAIDHLHAEKTGSVDLFGMLSGNAEAVGNDIPSGQRNSTLASIVGTMRRIGMSAVEILPAIETVNQKRCKPPLPLSEVKHVVTSISRYEPDQVSTAVVEGHWEQDRAELNNTDRPTDPGPTPVELLRVPGFVSEVMDYCLDTAPYPNQVLAFAGALALQAVLGGRKVRDPGNNRTNLYLLGLAHSGAGKEFPRMINTQVLHAVGLAGCLGERFASGPGLEDALFVSPSMLFQTDEIDGILQTINKSKDGSQETLLTTILTMYSRANTVFSMRAKAGRESCGVINQPCLVIFGTAIPNHYYAAMSERMLTNGTFARMLVLESALRSEGQEPGIHDVPVRVLETAQWWADFRSDGNLATENPEVATVHHTKAARAVLRDSRTEADNSYKKAESANDAVGTTVWSRANEQSRKLALLYAISENHQAPEIPKKAAVWAVALIRHQIERMLFMADEHTYETPFQAKCQRLVAILRQWKGVKGDAWMPFWRLSRKLPWNGREHDEVREALINQGVIEYEGKKTGGTPKRLYRIRSI